MWLLWKHSDAARLCALPLAALGSVTCSYTR
jgi:hypothetical protein